MTALPVRVGLIGAGANTVARHIPGFRAIPGVTIAAVANRTLASAQKIATQHAIPATYGTWQELLADPQIDAVCIGTWPDTHAEITCAALKAGKHVLCEARMARNVAEARQMLLASQERPQQVAMLVPSPFGLRVDAEVRNLIERNFIGDLRQVVVIGLDDQFYDYSQNLHWRQDIEKSGLNALTMGILHETAMRWIPPTKKVFAQTQIFEPTRPDPHSDENLPVTTPELVHVLTELEGHARGVYQFSGMALHAPVKQIHLYGSTGTIRVEFGATEKLLVGRPGQPQLVEVEIPAERVGKWRVEAEFIGAIRGEEPVRLTSFATGLEYMKFTEAVARSAQASRQVSLEETLA
ncbi:Gfo/Idh/MocA family protein [Planctopirus hydrillae]|uniref:Oxidoreductase n=1 Tax=Planctopirus hydrillae TaxID=1841610 RepID=A0A1C3EUF8_9PLAN|nr:Gfo/Idh/MocA family oxidoreductase [Planctopirus hydrillae]ODA36804.1 oxidoreductase [Planctopirus hydrillae]